MVFTLTLQPLSDFRDLLRSVSAPPPQTWKANGIQMLLSTAPCSSERLRSAAEMAAFSLAGRLGSRLAQLYLTACNDNKLQFVVMGRMYLSGHSVAVSAHVLNKWL